MKGPLLGIIVVICLQLGLVAYNAIDRSFESLFTVESLIKGTNSVAGPFDDRIFTDISDTVNYRSISRRNTVERSTLSASNKTGSDIEALYASDKGVVALPNTRASKLTKQLVAMERPFESTVITYPGYPQPIRAGGESDNYQMTTRTASTESKSFASKSLSVIKKPYKWLKALGSKLD